MRALHFPDVHGRAGRHGGRKENRPGIMNRALRWISRSYLWHLSNRTPTNNIEFHSFESIQSFSGKLVIYKMFGCGHSFVVSLLVVSSAVALFITYYFRAEKLFIVVFCSWLESLRPMLKCEVGKVLQPAWRPPRIQWQTRKENATRKCSSPMTD